MEIKKVITIFLISVLLPLFLSCDNLQYKKIGDTNFYLFPDSQGNGACLYFSEDKEVFFPIINEGIVSDIYWNQQYIIAKCNKKNNKCWYLMKNVKDYNWKEFEIKQFLNAKDFEKALDSMGISLKHMKHTDGTIPWCINF